MRTHRTLLVASLLCAGASTALAGGQAPLTLDVVEDVYDVNELVQIHMSGGPDDGLVLLLLDLQPGPSIYPGVGELAVGLSANFAYLPLAPVAEGNTVDCGPFDCDFELLNTKVYMQLVAFDTQGGSYVSNGDCFLVQDLDGECEATGCTPGYWKNHVATWAPTGYTPDMDYDDVFGINLFGPGVTLLEVLDPPATFSALEFHSVAALLNAAHPSESYAFSAQEVIDLTADAFMNGSAQDMEALKNSFDAANNAGCPF